MHPNIDVRWEAGVGTWIFNCARARAVLISTTHLIAASRAAHEFQTSCKHASPGALLCSMFSGSTWWNGEKTAQSLGSASVSATPVSAEDFQRHRFAAGELGIRGLASGLASTLCWAHLCRFPFSLHQTESQSRCTAGRFLSIRNGIPTTALLEIFL